MKLNKLGIARASAMIAVTLFIGIASSHADVSGSLWEGAAASADSIPSGSPDVTFTSSQIYYNSDLGGYTIGDFLNSAGTTSTILTGSGELGNTSDNTFIRLTGQIYLTAGLNAFQVGHDDGLNISLDGGIGTVLDEPGPTGFTLTPFNITAPSTGLYDFTLDYNECCGPPAVLEWAFPSGAPLTGGVPDGGTTLSLLGLSLAGLGAFARRLKK